LNPPLFYPAVLCITGVAIGWGHVAVEHVPGLSQPETAESSRASARALRPSASTRSCSPPASPDPERSTIPTLKILEPRDGQTITLPTEITYEVSGIEVGGSSGVHLHVVVEGVEDGFHVEVPLDKESRIAKLPADKRLTGRRDLTFQLARPDHTPLENTEARYTVRNLTIEGTRSG
jgi:hypothetical protein